jgi:hypothetical protein
MQDSSWEYNIRWEKHGHQLLIDHSYLFKNFPKGKFLVEIGSDRGEGSTKALAELALELKLNFITVDMNWDIYKRALEIVHEVNPTFAAECDKGEDFINFFAEEDIAILYLDAYDTMPPGFELPKDIKDPYIENMGRWDNFDAWNMHLQCCVVANKKLMPGGYVCFDDVWRKDNVWAKRSKGYTAIPWLMDRGYKEIKYVDGCILLRKPVSAEVNLEK